jgi:2-oxoglutarate dehydrogenase E2 component (dihydrolipoamide succinyltransferase)
MAESITEGTLKQFSKKVGDRVEVDEEIATIETDKVFYNPPFWHRLTRLD